MRMFLAFALLFSLLIPAPAMAKHRAPLLTSAGKSCVAGRLPPAQRWRGASVRCVRAKPVHAKGLAR